MLPAMASLPSLGPCSSAGPPRPGHRRGQGTGPAGATHWYLRVTRNLPTAGDFW